MRYEAFWWSAEHISFMSRKASVLSGDTDGLGGGCCAWDASLGQGSRRHRDLGARCRHGPSKN